MVERRGSEGQGGQNRSDGAWWRSGDRSGGGCEVGVTERGRRGALPECGEWSLESQGAGRAERWRLAVAEEVGGVEVGARQGPERLELERLELERLTPEGPEWRRLQILGVERLDGAGERGCGWRGWDRRGGRWNRRDELVRWGVERRMV